ncbi:MAG: adenylate/guanylate cyclase domain-containing protein [Xanthobacteraceae bacterium]
MSSADSIIHQNILANMADGVLTLDMAGRITTLNPAAAKLLGVAPDETAGRSFAETFIAEEAFEPLVELVLKAIYDSASTHSEEITLAWPDGRRVPLNVSTTYMRGEDGRTLGIIVVLTDLSERHRRRKMRRLMGQYIDTRIVGLLLARPEDGAGTQPEARRVMTVSFCDLANFTSLTETLPAERLLELLNTYLGLMSVAIGAAQGITDKYIGDAVMAYWGPPFNPEAEQAALACTAALAQVERLAALRTLAGPLLGTIPPERLDLRIGIATGPVIAGDIGPENARNFTLIGDSVNVAARLEADNKIFGTRILTDEQTMRLAGPGFLFREIDSIVLRGLSRPQRVYELMCRTESAGAVERALCAAYAAGLAALRAGDLGSAGRYALDALALVPQDGPSRRLLALGTTPQLP